MNQETDLIRKRYDRRMADGAGRSWHPLQPYSLYIHQEKERALARLFREKIGMDALAETRCMELGCGSGANLEQLVRLGFSPENLLGNELLEEPAAQARRKLPASLKIEVGDALEMDLPPESFDIVFQSTVFTSILDDDFQNRLAARMWEWVRPGGAVLWFDFTFNNPKNPDVRGIRLARIQELFPEGRITARKLVLAPPIGRPATRLWPPLYTVLNSLPLLRTHILCWIEK